MKQERILIIAQDNNFASQVQGTLRNDGYHVWQASSWIDGLNKLHKTSQDLVIMESETLPVNKRVPLLHIRQSSYLPIIIVGHDKDPTKMLEFGADFYMSKPPNLQELTARVRALLRRRNI